MKKLGMLCAGLGLLGMSGFLTGCATGEDLDRKLEKRNENYLQREENRQKRKDAREERYDAWYDRVMSD